MQEIKSFSDLVSLIYANGCLAEAWASLSPGLRALTSADRAAVRLLGQDEARTARNLGPAGRASAPTHDGDQLLASDEGVLTFVETLETLDPSRTATSIAIELEFKDPGPQCMANARAIVSALMPHFHKAFTIWTETRRDAFALSITDSLLDSFDGMLAILDSEARVARSNEIFRTFIVDDKGLDIDESGSVVFKAAQDQQLFRQTLATAMSSKQTGAFQCKLGGPDPVVVLVSPLRPADPTTGPLILFAIRAAQPQSSSAHVLQALYGLTRAEIRVTDLVVQGASIEEAALQIGVSKITARNQLTSAMSKLGVSRQARLVSLVLNLCPKLSG